MGNRSGKWYSFFLGERPQQLWLKNALPAGVSSGHHLPPRAAMLQDMGCHLQSRRLYIADLARRLYEMELGEVPIQPLVFRVVAKRLREALAGLPESVARAGFAELPVHLMPLLAEVLERRHFDQHGRLPGDSARACRDQAETLFSRLRRPSVR